MFRVRVNQIFTRLEAKHAVPVTAATIAAYYKSHGSQFGTPESRNIRIVRTKTAAAAAAAKAALASGSSWATVAKKYSIDTATKNTGGLLNGVTNGQEETALNTAAFAAPVNKLEGVIHGTFGYYVFEVVKITPSTQQTLAQATPLIKELLTSQTQTTEQTAVDKVAKAHWLAKTKCRAEFAMADCAGYKAPKTSSTAASSAATGASTGASATPTTSSATPTSSSATPTASSTTPTVATSTASSSGAATTSTAP
jgi:foldase protein PrsA